MTRFPSISVLVPAHNAQRTLGGTLTGLLTLDYPGPVEIIVVDDGSTDDTARILAAYSEWVHVLSQSNRGTAAARNAAAAVAGGELIALCDADDILLPPYLRAAVATWHAAGAGRRFVTCNALLLTEGGIAHRRTVLHPAVPPPDRQRLEILAANFVAVFAVMPREMLTQLGGWNPECYLEDWDLWIRAIHAGWRAVPQTVPHALYRWLPTSKSTRSSAVYTAEDELLHRFRKRATHLTAAERAYLDRRMAARSPRLLVHEAEAALRHGERERARRLYSLAASLSPGNDRLRLKARTLALPGAAALWSRRLHAIDAELMRNTDVAR